MTDREGFYVYRDGARKWRWRYVSGNERIQADGAQGYTRRADCLRGLKDYRASSAEAPVRVIDHDLPFMEWLEMTMVKDGLSADVEKNLARMRREQAALTAIGQRLTAKAAHLDGTPVKRGAPGDLAKGAPDVRLPKPKGPGVVGVSEAKR